MLLNLVSRKTVLTITLFLLANCRILNAELAPKTLPVLAIEYPPYVSNDLPNSGYSYQFLQSLFEPETLIIKPDVLSMPRLQLVLEGNQWCASLMPPASVSDNVYIHRFENRGIKHRLFRLRQTSSFSWQELSELKGLRIATFRSRQFNALRQMLKKAGLKTVPINSIEQAIQLLTYERVDLIFSDLKSVNYLTKKMGLEPQRLQESQNIIVNRRSRIWLNLNCDAANIALKILQRASPSLPAK